MRKQIHRWKVRSNIYPSIYCVSGTLFIKCLMWALLLPPSDIETGTRRWKAAFLIRKIGKCCSRHRSSHGLFPGLIFKHHTTLISWISIFVLKHTHLILYICCSVWCHYCSVAKSCPTLFDCMNCGTPGSSILHYLLKFAAIHVHTWVSDAI